MKAFVLVMIDASGGEATEWREFALRIDVIRFARGQVPAGGQVSVGELIDGQVDWLGSWTMAPHGPTWEPVE